MIELVRSRAEVVLPAVPGAGEHRALEPPLAERPLEVKAGVLGRVEVPVHVRERDRVLAYVNRLDSPGRDLLDPRRGRKLDGRHEARVTRGCWPFCDAERECYARPVATILLAG